jgi:DNA-binding CsgD family transcriptional regulator
VLYGRDSERARVNQLLHGARASRSAVLVVRGEAGVGKSALLEAARAEAGDMQVLAARGIESEAPLPYAGLHQLLRPLLGHLDALAAPQARALRGALGLEEGASDEWFLVSLATLSLLAEAAEGRPLLCLVDDAHWLDDASAESLLFAGRRLHAEGIVMLFAAREGEERSFAAPGLEELTLGGLGPEAAEALLARNAPGALSAGARERLIAGTGGNPLALLELSASLSDAQLAGVEPLLEPLPVSERVERAFLDRARRLPDETRTLLLVAAADEAGGPGTVLRAASRLGAGPEALDAAEAAGLLRAHGSRLEFRHPLIRSAVYHAAPLSRRQAAHRALADVLDAPGDADRRAWHRAAGCVEPDADVVEELERAAGRARRRSAYVAAALAYERAAGLAPEEARRVRLLIDAAESAWFAGRSEGALMLLERARPLAAGPAERAEIDCCRALIEVNVGVPADACELLVRGAPDMAAVDRERALYMLAVACVAAGYSDDAARVAAIAAMAEGIPAGEAAVGRFLGHFLRGTGAFFGEDFATAAPSLRAALALADEADEIDSFRLMGLLIIAGGAALFMGDDAAAARLNRRLVGRARENGALTLLTQALPRLALTQIGSGQWAAASAGLEEGLQIARETGQHQVVAHMLSERALMAALRGDGEECRALAAESRGLAAVRRLQHVDQTALWALVALELGQGRPDEALAAAREVVALPVTLWAGLDRIEAAIRAGDAEAAAPWLATFESWAEAGGATWARAAALHCRALLCQEPAAAERLFIRALAAHDEGGRPFERCRTELAFGEFLRRSRRRVEARAHLRVALGGFETLGAAPWAERARAELRASGQTARRRGPSSTDELTAQELQIAHFVAEGLSNREVAAQLFLSPRTIDFHLRNVFRKLGIRSRTELARLELRPAAVPAG